MHVEYKIRVIVDSDSVQSFLSAIMHFVLL